MPGQCTPDITYGCARVTLASGGKTADIPYVRVHFDGQRRVFVKGVAVVAALTEFSHAGSKGAFKQLRKDNAALKPAEMLLPATLSKSVFDDDNDTMAYFHTWDKAKVIVLSREGVAALAAECWFGKTSENMETLLEQLKEVVWDSTTNEEPVRVVKKRKAEATDVQKEEEDAFEKAVRHCQLLLSTIKDVYRQMEAGDLETGTARTIILSLTQTYAKQQLRPSSSPQPRDATGES